MNIDKRLLRKDSLEKLFDILKQSSKNIYAPVTRNGKILFKVVANYKDIAFPRTEKILDYTKNKEGITVKPFDYQVIPDAIVWGVRPCDAMATGELSTIFNWDLNDEIYNSRISHTTILSFSCSKADESCFCTSVGGNPGNTAGSDILFTQMGDNGDYLAEIITEKGSAVVAMASGLFEEITDTEKEKYLAVVPVKFDQKGQNSGARAILQQMQGGAYVTIYPFELATKDVVYPTPPWSQRK